MAANEVSVRTGHPRAPKIWPTPEPVPGKKIKQASKNLTDSPPHEILAKNLGGDPQVPTLDKSHSQDVRAWT
jgi:hypothetical protein